MNSSLAQRIAALSPAKRALLANRLPTPPQAESRILRRKREDRAVLSSAQLALWVLDQLVPGTSLYNIPCAMRMRGVLDTVALRRAVQLLADRHEALRTTFTLDDETVMQLIATHAAVPLDELDLGGWPAEDREAEFERSVKAEALRPFDLERGPLIRALLIRLGDDDHCLMLTVHHIVVDGWSLDMLFGELSEAYSAYVAGEAPALPELRVHLGDVTEWQQHMLAGDRLEALLDYWKQHLEGCAGVLDLATDHPRPPIQASSGGSRSYELPGSLTDRLRAISRQEGATLYMTLLAAWLALLHGWTGREDLVVGTPVAGREHPDTEGVVGFLVNMLPLRTSLAGNPTFRELLRRARDTSLGAFSHQELPFLTLVEALHPPRLPGRNPIFQVVFAMMMGRSHTVHLPGLELSRVDFGCLTAKFDLTLAVSEAPDHLTAAFEYNTDLFEAPTVDRFLLDLHALLERVAADPDVRLGDLRQAYISGEGTP